MTNTNYSNAVAELKNSVKNNCIVFSKVEIETSTCEKETFYAPGCSRETLLRTRCEKQFNESEMESMKFVCRVDTYTYGSDTGLKRNSNISELDNLERSFDELLKDGTLSLKGTEIYRFNLEAEQENEDEDEMEI